MQNEEVIAGWPECPWPEEVWPMTEAQYVAAVPDPQLRTAISGFLMRRGWQVASKDIAKVVGRALRLAVVQTRREDVRIIVTQINSPTSTPAACAVELMQRSLNELEDRLGEVTSVPTDHHTGLATAAASPPAPPVPPASP